MYNKVELCGVNTAELPILSEQEKRDLLTRARAGDKEARQSMIEGNLRLVLPVVQQVYTDQTIRDFHVIRCGIRHLTPERVLQWESKAVQR